MMNWEKRKEEIQKDKLLNSYFIAKYEKAIDNLIEQEKEMIRKMLNEIDDRCYRDFSHTEDKDILLNNINELLKENNIEGI